MTPWRFALGLRTPPTRASDPAARLALSLPSRSLSCGAFRPPLARSPASKAPTHRIAARAVASSRSSRSRANASGASTSGSPVNFASAFLRLLSSARSTRRRAAALSATASAAWSANGSLSASTRRAILNRTPGSSASASAASRSRSSHARTFQSRSGGNRSGGSSSLAYSCHAPERYFTRAQSAANRWYRRSRYISASNHSRWRCSTHAAWTSLSGRHRSAAPRGVRASAAAASHAARRTAPESGSSMSRRASGAKHARCATNTPPHVVARADTASHACTRTCAPTLSPAKCVWSTSCHIAASSATSSLASAVSVSKPPPSS